MQKKSTTISFKGQKIYVGIDVHLKSWKVTIMLEHSTHKTFSQDASASDLGNYLKKNFPEGAYYSAYEASFCGFSVHRALEENGINNIVVNPADIPTTDKERKQKEDKRDSRKIAQSLRSGSLVGIYIPSTSMVEFRGLVRYRKTLVKEINRNKNRIKSLLYFYGVIIPPALDTASRHWSGRFTKWLGTLELNTIYGTTVLNDLIDITLKLRKNLLEVEQVLRGVAKDGEYSRQLSYLISTPGIGLITACLLWAEIGDFRRFKNNDTFCSYIGLIPTTYSSGEKEITGNITPRSNNILRNGIIEAAWIARRRDPSLALAYNELCKRMKPNQAIIRIAKKLLNRIRHVMINETEYVYAVV